MKSWLFCNQAGPAHALALPIDSLGKLIIRPWEIPLLDTPRVWLVKRCIFNSRRSVLARFGVGAISQGPACAWNCRLSSRGQDFELICFVYTCLKRRMQATVPITPLWRTM